MPSEQKLITFVILEETRKTLAGKWRLVWEKIGEVDAEDVYEAEGIAHSGLNIKDYSNRNRFKVVEKEKYEENEFKMDNRLRLY